MRDQDHNRWVALKKIRSQTPVTVRTGDFSHNAHVMAVVILYSSQFRLIKFYKHLERICNKSFKIKLDLFQSCYTYRAVIWCNDKILLENLNYELYN